MFNTSQLPESDWSPQQEAYIEWLALPQQDRVPKTELALARELGVDRTTLYRWRKDPDLLEEVRWLCLSMMGPRLADVLATVEESALSGSLLHQRLYFDLLRMIGRHREIERPMTYEQANGVKYIPGVDLSRARMEREWARLYPDTKSSPTNATP